MKIVREVIVFDAADMRAESRFWAEIYGGQVFEDEAWHSVIDAAGNWRIGVQLKPDHVPPDWPDGTPQQVGLDLHVDHPRAAPDGSHLLCPANVAALRPPASPSLERPRWSTLTRVTSRLCADCNETSRLCV